jgi:hypothetical protein
MSSGAGALKATGTSDANSSTSVRRVHNTSIACGVPAREVLLPTGTSGTPGGTCRCQEARAEDTHKRDARATEPVVLNGTRRLVEGFTGGQIPNFDPAKLIVTGIIEAGYTVGLLR